MSAKDLQKLKDLKDGECTQLNWYDGGGAEVERVGTDYILSEIPQYGGMPQYYGTYTSDRFDEIIKTVNTWN